MLLLQRAVAMAVEEAVEGAEFLLSLDAAVNKKVNSAISV
jgi:hypothetical protein